MSVEAPHARPWREVADLLEVDVEAGLSRGEASRRLAREGQNVLRPPPRARAWRILLDQFRSAVVLLLLVASGLAFAFGQALEGLAILVVVALNAAIGFGTEVKAVRSMEALRRLTAVSARARRDAVVVQLPAARLVPGDVVVLEAGDLVPADVRLVAPRRLETNESALTGESFPVAKSQEPVDADAPVADRACMVFQGTSVTRGFATGIVAATGAKTQLAQIAKLAEEAPEPPSALEARVNRLGRQMVWVIVAVGAGVVALGLAGGRPPLLMVETAIALAVAAIPEGLPAVATLALARGMLLMARRNALARRLAAVETLGVTNVLCVDKTGTLTENRLEVVGLLLPEGDVDFDDRPPPEGTLREALSVAALCNNASLDAEGAGSGDPLEVALLQAAHRFGLDPAALAREQPREHEEPFDPATRLMATWHRTDAGLRLAVKGAPEAVLASCTRVHGRPGGLDERERAEWSRRNEALTADGLRVLALATRPVASTGERPYRDLSLLGLVSFLDPPRGDVAPAIAECQRAGVRVVMVTGDHAGTAAHVARSVGIVGDRARLVEGAEIPTDPEAIAEAARALARADVFARVAPAQKVSIVALHQAAGNVVAMTGDGVNDAPALQSADIGIAMGQRGTQVAREASDVVLRDDAFSTIVDAIRQGRIIFTNIRRFILYLLSCNVSEVLVVALAIAANAPLALLPLQILYLNLVTDVFPALALGLGRGGGGVMDKPPRGAGEPFLQRDHWIAIAVYGAVLSGAVLAAFGLALGPLGESPETAVSVSFLTLGFAQLWHVFNMRSAAAPLLRDEVVRNPYVWGALAICTILLLAAAHLPLLAEVLRVEALPAALWGLVLGASLVPLALGQIGRTLRARLAR